VQSSILVKSPRAPRRPPPLWFVTNGESTVGPVRTELLQRGVWFRRIPDDCLIRELTWRTWRPLEEIREVRAVHRAIEEGATSFLDLATRAELELSEHLSPASDAPEVLTLALHECCEQTRASFGMVHRAWSMHGAAITSAVRGIGMIARLGREVPEQDASMALAHVGGIVVAPPLAGSVERNIADRFGGPEDLGGVAMVPVSEGPHLLAVIELGRIGHPFRSSDVGVLERVARAAAAHIRRFDG
jgi:hypothetical protein